MSELKQVAENASNLAKMYRSVLMLVDAANEIGDLENYRDGLTTSVESLKKQFDEVNDKVVVETSKLENIKSSITDAKAELDKLQKQQLNMANDEAGAIVSKARTEAAALKKSAENEILEIVRKKKSAENDLTVVQKKVADANSELSRVNAVITEARAKLGEN